MSSLVPRTALPGRSQSSHDRLAKGLGYFSLALGAAELIAPRVICRATGLDGRETLVRAYGGREIMTGLAILASHDATPFVWGRVAGDAADISTLAAAAGNAASARTLATIAVLAGATALDAFCAVSLSGEKGRRRTATADYRDRSGFPRGLEAARGAARGFRPPGGRPPESSRFSAASPAPQHEAAIGSVPAAGP